MSEPASPPGARAIEAPRWDAQLIVACAIVAALGIITLALVAAAAYTNAWDTLGVPIGTAIGALATALNAPSGTASAIKALRAGPGQ